MIGLNRRRVMVGYGDIIIMTSETNPEVMSLMYSKGYAASPYEMWKSEAELVSTMQIQNSNITAFDEFRYFSGVTSLGSRAFYNNTKLTSIIFPNSVNYLDSDCFRQCTSLTNCVLPENPNLALRANTFNDCRSLVSIVIPNGVVELRNNTFTRCYSLMNVVLPDTIIQLLNSVFINCSNMMEIILPKNLQSLGSQCFSGCTSLRTITCMAMTAPTIDTNTFYNVGTSYSGDKYIRVPQGATGYENWYSNGQLRGWIIQYI